MGTNNDRRSVTKSVSQLGGGARKREKGYDDRDTEIMTGAGLQGVAEAGPARRRQRNSAAGVGESDGQRCP